MWNKEEEEEVIMLYGGRGSSSEASPIITVLPWWTRPSAERYGNNIKENTMQTEFMRNYIKQSQGKNIYVKPRTGSDSNSGLTPIAAVKTLTKALSLATANQNDTVYLMCEGNSAANTTDYQSATLNWNKDGVHLIGVGVASDTYIGQRARVALVSTFVTASNLFTLSANNCFIKGIEFFAGVASANPVGAVNVTGMRNTFENCQISGIGDATMDIATGYSLTVAGSENVFKKCLIGLDTIVRGVALAEIRITSGTRTIFDDCIILSFSSLTTFKAVLWTAGSYHTLTLFKNCIIINEINRTGAVTVTGALSFGAAGNVVLQNSFVAGYSGVSTSDNANIYTGGAIGGAQSCLAVPADIAT